MPRKEAYLQGYEDGYYDAKEGYGLDIPAVGRIISKRDYAGKPKPKRKPTAYQKRYGTAYKKLKRKHPRMSFGSLSKKAHRMARK